MLAGSIVTETVELAGSSASSSRVASKSSNDRVGFDSPRWL